MQAHEVCQLCLMFKHIITHRTAANLSDYSAKVARAFQLHSVAILVLDLFIAIDAKLSHLTPSRIVVRHAAVWMAKYHQKQCI
jgi:hypothetical protein